MNLMGSTLLTFLVIVIPISGVSASSSRRMIGTLKGTAVQGTIQIITTVSSLLDCGFLCYLQENCDTISFNHTTRICVTLFNQTHDHTIRNDIIGAVFKLKADKACKYADYEYVWELDICVKFYTAPKKSWDNSNTRCEDEAGALLSLETKTKEALFRHYIMRAYDLYNIVRWWIGANDKNIEGSFVWTSGQNMSDSNWDPSEPDNANADSSELNADCVVYFKSRKGEYLFVWTDTTCDSQVASICENKAFI